MTVPCGNGDIGILKQLSQLNSKRNQKENQRNRKAVGGNMSITPRNKLPCSGWGASKL